MLSLGVFGDSSRFTREIHSLRYSVILLASHTDSNPRSWQLDLTLSSHLLGGLPLGLRPSMLHSRAILGNLVFDILDTCPKYRSCLCWIFCTMEISQLFCALVVTFLIPSLRETPVIRLRQDISKVRSRCSSFFLKDQDSIGSN